MLDTAAKPPHPAARTSLAAHNRRVRSSAFEAKASHRRIPVDHADRGSNQPVD
jgi:hypothetical protein